jgi:hypothetical protein
MQAKNYEAPRQEEFGVENAGYLGDFSGVFNSLFVSQMKSYRSSVNNPGARILAQAHLFRHCPGS